VQIDIVSDTVCPWCFIGKRKLERALAMRPDVTAQVFWRPYRLDPNIPKGGVDRKAYMQAKFGDNPNAGAMRDTLVDEGAKLGIDFAFDRIAISPNTLDSHRLVRWAGGAGVQNEVVERLFKAYFIEGRDIGDASVLLDIATAAGMHAALVADLLANDSDLAEVEREAGMANQMGITGVPCFIFDGRFMISGAREPDVLVKVIDKVLQEPLAVPAQSAP
jgi:predicted DsbA family dithiol-disulfide isomerase